MNPRKRTRLVTESTLCNVRRMIAVGAALVALLAAAAVSWSQTPPPCVVNGMEITSRVLPAGTGGDLTVTKGECTVGGNVPFKYRNVNIYDGGKLTFLDGRTADIQFYARSILIENKGSLVAGSASKRFGSLGGKLTIHLWGAQNDPDPAITCKTGDHCGVPDTKPNDIWGSNPISGMNPSSCNTSTLPPAT